MERVSSKSATEVVGAVIRMLTPYKDHLHTITSDNGKEFAYHEVIAQGIEVDFYFSKPYHSWQRGSNENANGLYQGIPTQENRL